MDPEAPKNAGAPQERGPEPLSVPIPPATAVPIPDHELIKCIGQGSYGQVWLARNMMGAWRAVKIVFRSSFTHARPFERELSGIRKFEPVSRLHEGFVDVLHVGINEHLEYFYYVMEVGDDQVTGQNIDPDAYHPKTLSSEIQRVGRLSLQECLHWAIDLAHALAELHKHELVHRDIKPSNIIFVNGKPKLADIGLVAEFDETRSFVGTEGFIPPEGPGTPQADVFSLGKVLYEASTGKDRLEFPDLPVEWQHSPEYAGLLELNEVILRACQWDAAKRYASAWEMHADLLLILNGKSVRRLRMLEKRLSNLKRLAAGALAACGVLGLLFYHFYREWTNARENRQHQVSANLSYANRAVDSGDLLSALPYFAESLRLEGTDSENAASHRLRFYSTLAQCPKPIQMWSAATRLNWGTFAPDGRKVLLAEHFGKAQVRDLATGELCFSTFGPESGLNSAAYSPDGQFIVTASQNNTALVWDSRSLSIVHDLPHTQKVFSARFSADATRIVTACLDGKAYVWDAANGKQLFALGDYQGGVSYADFSPDGQLIALTTFEAGTSIWSATNGQPTRLSFPHKTWMVHAAFSPDNRRLAAVSTDHKVRVWDLANGMRIFPDLNHDDAVRSVVFSPDGRFILTASFDGTARLWHAASLQPIASNPILRHAEPLNSATFSPDSRLVLTTCMDGSARVWDLAGCLLPPPPKLASISSDASRFVTFTNQEFQVWDAVTGQRVASPQRCAGPLSKLAFNKDASFLLTVSVGADAKTNYLVEVWDVATGREVGRKIELTNSIAGAIPSGDGKIAVIWMDNKAQIWDVLTGSPHSPPLIHEQAIKSAAFNQAGNHLLTISGANVHIWETKSGRMLYAPLSQPQPVTCAKFSRDDRYLVVSSANPSVSRSFAQIYKAATGEPVGNPLQHRDGVLYATFSPDASRVVTASEDFTAKVWETATGRQIGLPLRHREQVKAACFTADGKWVATVDADGFARIWDPQSSEPLTPPMRHLSSPADVRFLSDGKQLAVIDTRGQLFFWSLPSGTGSQADLAELGEFLSGGQVFTSTAPEQARKATVMEAWQSLRQKFPNNFATSSEQIRRWHTFQVEESESRGDWPAAFFHLQHLLRMDPENICLAEQVTNARNRSKDSDYQR
ncbi:MAG TPA: protein kinase [Clostridia bacterium]|nr:protein kinase [Clostridia bacterium]